MAQLVSEKLANGINEESIADKTAAAISNYLPEIDADDIADKVAAAVLASIPATEIDYDTIINGVCEKLNAQTAAEAEVAETAEAEGETVEAAAADVQPEEQIAPEDYDIVIDDEGLQRITESISWKVTAATNAKFEEMDGRLGEVKQELADIRAALEKAQEEQPAAEEEQPAPEDAAAEEVVAEESAEEQPEAVSAEEIAEITAS